MMTQTKKQKIGDIGENVAEKYLLRKGYKILDTNYRKKCGEIDIIAEKAGIMRFVEVKTANTTGSRETDLIVTPEEQAHQNKLKRVARASETWMAEKNREDDEYHIDVVTVRLDTETRIAKCRLFEEVM